MSSKLAAALYVTECSVWLLQHNFECLRGYVSHTFMCAYAEGFHVVLCKHNMYM